MNRDNMGDGFDKDIDDYLKKRKHEEAYEYPAQPTTPSPAPVEMPISEEPKKPGFFSRLFARTPAEPEAVPVLSMANDDLKTVSKMTLKLIKMLPPKDLEEFKNSEDFLTFKEILKRNNLVK